MSYPYQGHHGHHEQDHVSSQQDDGYATALIDEILTCAFCKCTFSTANALRRHKLNMSKEESAPGKVLKHIYCHICDKDFVSITAGRQHWIQRHAEKQNINCPGCNAFFVHFSGFIKHIECDECPTISQENASARCKKSLEFAKALSKLDSQRPELDTVKGPKDFGSYLGNDSEPIKPISLEPVPTSPWCTQESGSWGSPQADAPRQECFPALARPGHLSKASKASGVQTEIEDVRPQQEQHANAWASANTPATYLFPKAAPAQAPTAEQLDSLRAHQNASMEKARAEHIDPDHPHSPYFDAERYWNAYTKGYKCSRSGCKKTFTNKGALVQHLLSPAHTFGKVYTCPNCLKQFSALYSLAAHCESASHKCHIRHSDMYERFLSQLTWNLVEITGEHEQDGTHKYDISTSARVDYGLRKDEKVTLGHQTPDRARNVVMSTAPSKSSIQTRLTMEALAQHQQQHQQPQQRQAKPAGRQPMQNVKLEQQDERKADKGSMTLTAAALAQLDLQERQKVRSTPHGQKLQAFVPQDDGNTQPYGQDDWRRGNSAGEE